MTLITRPNTILSTVYYDIEYQNFFSALLFYFVQGTIIELTKLLFCGHLAKVWNVFFHIEK